jgi:hypothetical protein
MLLMVYLRNLQRFYGIKPPRLGDVRLVTSSRTRYSELLASGAFFIPGKAREVRTRE